MMVSTDSRRLKEELYCLLMMKKAKEDALRLQSFRPNPGFQQRFFESSAKIRLALSGNQCLAGESKIYDPVEKQYRRVDSIKSKFNVVSYDGKKLIATRALAPFAKGYEALYEVRLKNGKRFTSTLGHMVLTPDGYRSISWIVSVSTRPFFLSRPQSNLGHGPLALFSGAQHLMRKALGSLYYYLIDYCLYGEPPQFLKDSCQGVSALLSYVRPYNRLFLIRGNLDQPNDLGIHLSSKLYRPSSPGVQARNGGLFAGLLFQVHDKALKLFCYLFRSVPQPICAYEPHPLSSDEEALGQSFGTYKTSIKSIRYLRDDIFYDFHVPNTNNYLFNGAVHHNSGKTHVGAVELSMLALGVHPHKKLKRCPNITVVVSAQGFKEGIEKTIMPKFKAVVGSNDMVKIKKNSQGIPTQIIWSNGSITHLMSAEQDDDVFEGTTLDAFWIDEPVRRNIFVALKRGMLTTDGICWLTCTPLSEPWIYEELYMKSVEGKDKSIEVFEGTSDENKMISEQAKEDFKSILTEDEIDARWRGKFRHLSGRVFKEYDPDRHLIDPFDIPREWPVWLAIDPHRKKPHAVLFIAVSPEHKYYWCNEIYWKFPKPEDFAKCILDISAQYTIHSRLIDTSAQESGWVKDSMREILQRNGVSTRLAQKKNLKKSGIIIINQNFAKDNMFVFKTCKRAHRELMNQIYKKNKMDSQIIIEEPEKKFDDITDCARYVLVEKPYYKSRVKIKEIGPIYVKVENYGRRRIQRSKFSR